MNTKKVPLRTCAITHEKLPKSELLRIVRMPDGNVVVDTTGKVNGHGVYVKKDISIMDRMINSRNLERLLECPIPYTVYDEIKDILSK